MKSDVRARWSHAILVCKKCSKKQSKCFGPKGKRLAAALKVELGGGKGRKSPLGIIEVPCLDVCPKRGVVLVDTRMPGQWRIVTPDVDLGELASQLL